jgi:hypothetical protein
MVMDTQHFDTFTRSLAATSSRRRALAALASALSAAVPLATLREAAEARKKRRRKRKKKPSAKTPPLTCPPGRVACDGACLLPDAAPCSDDAQCCSTDCAAQQCRPCHGEMCVTDFDCCPGVTCQAGRCGGCLGFAASCQTDQDCCFSACNQDHCVSGKGQRCATGADCVRCLLSGFDPAVCATACVGGICACPTECCHDIDCIAGKCIAGTCEISGGG